jgi:hypothetical protein
MLEIIGGPDRDRTDDLFHAMEARSQLRHRPTFRWGQLSYFRRSGPIRQTSFCDPSRRAFSIPPTIISRPAINRRS